MPLQYLPIATGCRTADACYVQSGETYLYEHACSVEIPMLELMSTRNYIIPISTSHQYNGHHKVSSSGNGSKKILVLIYFYAYILQT